MLRQGLRTLVPTLLPLLLTMAATANAQPSPMQNMTEQPSLAPPTPSVVESVSATWPLALGMHVLAGVEPHDRGNAFAAGAGAELLWKGRMGGFVALLASEGTPIIAPEVNGVQTPSFGDRVSIPFGFAIRPVSWWALKRYDYLGRFLEGIGAQVGLTIEHLRTSDDSATTAGLHLGLGVEVPLWGGAREGGVALRLYGRLLFTPAVNLDLDKTSNLYKVYEPPASGQLFAGIEYYP
jgi:hypothetical protein